MSYTDTWNSAFEGIPGNDDNISAGAEDIRDFKLAVRERLAKDHYADIAGTDADHGEHLKTTFHAPLAADPAPGAEKAALYTKDVDGKAELHWQDEDDNVVQITTAGALNVDLTEASIFNPTGCVVAYMASTAPTGWLECNGAAVSRSTYAALFAVIGDDFGVGNGSTTFNLPDLRGMFLRGWNHGRSDAFADPDVATRLNRGDGTTGDYIGTTQADEFEEHGQDFDYYGATGENRADGANDAAERASLSGTTDDAGGSTETRPKNIYVMYIIKT